MGKVIYCITTNDGALNLELNGITLETITAETLLAVVSDTEETRLRVSRANSLRHQRVIEHIMAQRPAVLPMRFSTIAESETVVAQHVLTRQSAALFGWLDQVRNTSEFSLKVAWPREALFAEVVKRDPELLTRRAEATTVNAQIALGQRIEQGIKTIHTETAQKVLTTLTGYYQEYRANESKDDTVSMNGAFLVKTDDQARFEQAVDACDTAFVGLLAFKLVGPLPAYSFIELTITLNDEGGIPQDGLPIQPAVTTNHGTD